jgi:iron-sulfur cluster assembly protein
MNDKVKTYTQTPITLTEAAAKHIQQQLQQHDNAIGFRLGVRDAGCNSKKYVTEPIEKAGNDDTQFVDKGITIYVSKADLLYVAGTEIDYAKEGINKVLKFNNPNASSECGCGESFNIDE